jgi:Flp pilus assembly pilin Flp
MTITPTQPTQVRRPWRATTRTVFQAFIGLCALAPILVAEAGLDPAKLPWLAVVLAVALAVTRVMAIPGVDAWLRRFLPFLAAAPPADVRRDERGASTVERALIVLGVVALVVLAIVVLTGQDLRIG